MLAVGWLPEQQSLFDYYREHCIGLSQITKHSWTKCAELGLLGLSVPKSYGGQGYDITTSANITQAFGNGCEDTGLMFSVCAHLYACLMPIVEFGSEQQKKKYLPLLTGGDWIAGNGMTEKEAGSDSSNIKSTAIKKGDHYILDGTKSYVTNGPVANVFIVYAVTDPALGYLGVSAFIVEKNTPGITIGDTFEKMGFNSTRGSAVSFNNCRIPVENRIGEEGQGLIIFKHSMKWERVCLFAGFLGVMERLHQQCIDHAKSRKQFGKPIGKNQAISHAIVDNQIKIESAQCLLHQACWLLDQNKKADMEISMTKIVISETFLKISLDAVQIFGSQGYNADGGIESYLRDAVGTKIFSGTSEMQRDIIAAELGL